jgi:hypothetical protein
MQSFYFLRISHITFILFSNSIYPIDSINFSVFPLISIDFDRFSEISLDFHGFQ